MAWSLRDIRESHSGWMYLAALGSVVMIATLCFGFSNYLGYRSVALILLMVVSLLALLADIGPVLLAATASALIWNFFFIPPLYTFHISSTEDTLMFLLYFVVVLVHAVLSNRIRKAEQATKAREDQQKSIALAFFGSRFAAALGGSDLRVLQIRRTGSLGSGFRPA